MQCKTDRNKRYKLRIRLTLKIVGCSSSTNVTEIKGSLSVYWVSGIAVRDKHLCERKAVEIAFAIKREIVKGQSYSKNQQSSKSANGNGSDLPSRQLKPTLKRHFSHSMR